MVDQTSLDRAATRPSKSYFQPRKSWWGRSPYDGNPRGRKGSL